MMLQFSFNEMMSALERAGYECRLEDEVEIRDYPGGREEHRPFKVWNIFYKGNKMTEAGWERLGGTQRVERVFRMELQKKLLNLF
jgi:hypothetical protein